MYIYAVKVCQRICAVSGRACFRFEGTPSDVAVKVVVQPCSSKRIRLQDNL